MLRFLAALVLLTSCAHADDAEQRLQTCSTIANRAQLGQGIMTYDAVIKLTIRALKDHNLVPPHRFGRRVTIHRMTQADIQAAADELKPCFPPE